MFTGCQSNAARAAAVRRRGAVSGLVLALVASAGGCGTVPAPTHIDLLSLLALAEKRPPGRPGESFVVRNVETGGRTMPAVVVPQPSRIVWNLKIPRKATLTTHAGFEPDRTGKYAGDAVFRIGVSGGKLYEKVFERRMNPGQVESDRALLPITVDLSAWAGWQWSLFYRPSERAWNVVFSVDGTPSTAVPLWVAPAIEGTR